MDVKAYNRSAWDHQVATENPWTVPVGPEEVARARAGEVRVLLTPRTFVPKDWLGPLAGKRVLCLASGGGQQGPLFAAAGASVVVFDNSPAQLERDRQVAARESLSLESELGDMTDLSRFAGASFDLVFHPSSNLFVPEVLPVWREAHRVLVPGGTMVAGFCNPVFFLFDDFEARQGRLVARHKLPYSDIDSLTAEERQYYLDRNEPLCYSHTLTDLLGGQCAAGFALIGLYEDYGRVEEQAKNPLDALMPAHIATRALKR